jgi:hypothetical protein
MPGQTFGHWNYNDVTIPKADGPEKSYELAVRWLDVQQGGHLDDWGGGTGFAKRYVTRGNYHLLDGAWSPWVNAVADLRTYIPGYQPDGILLRHVLEYNGQWRQIIANALTCVRARLCIVIGTPMVEPATTIVAKVPYSGVPIIHFTLKDLLSALYPNKTDVCSLTTKLPKDGGEITETFFFTQLQTGQNIVHLPGHFPPVLQPLAEVAAGTMPPKGGAA